MLSGFELYPCWVPLLNPSNFKKETIRTDISTASFWDPYSLFRQKQEQEVKKQFYSGGIVALFFCRKFEGTVRTALLYEKRAKT